MCIYVYMYMCICMYIYLCMYISMYVYMYMCICMYLYLYIHIHVYMYTYIYVYIYTCTCICVVPSACCGAALRLPWANTCSASLLTQWVVSRPTVIYFCVDDTFRLHGGGVYEADSCGTCANHAMLLTGYGSGWAPSLEGFTHHAARYAVPWEGHEARQLVARSAFHRTFQVPSKGCSLHADEHACCRTCMIVYGHPWCGHIVAHGMES